MFPLLSFFKPVFNLEPDVDFVGIYYSKFLVGRVFWIKTRMALSKLLWCTINNKNMTLSRFYLFRSDPKAINKIFPLKKLLVCRFCRSVLWTWKFGGCSYELSRPSMVGRFTSVRWFLSYIHMKSSIALQSKSLVCHWKNIVLITQFLSGFMFWSIFYHKQWCNLWETNSGKSSVHS